MTTLKNLAAAATVALIAGTAALPANAAVTSHTEITAISVHAPAASGFETIFIAPAPTGAHADAGTLQTADLGEKFDKFGQKARKAFKKNFGYFKKMNRKNRTPVNKRFRKSFR